MKERERGKQSKDEGGRMKKKQNPEVRGQNSEEKKIC
jgi:hypothetical protein